MIINGLDLSLNSTGCFKLFLDDDLKVTNVDYLGFTSVKKNQSEKIIHYKKEHFPSDLEKYNFFKDHIEKFCSGSEYCGIEGYSYASIGQVFQIAEFAGLVKNTLYHNGLKLRITDPTSIKLFATESGSANKILMYNALVKFKEENRFLDNFDLTKLPLVDEKHGKSGVSPTSDLVDACWISLLLLTELRLRKGLIRLKDLPESTIRVFNRVTKSNPQNILDSDFIEKK